MSHVRSKPVPEAAGKQTRRRWSGASVLALATALALPAYAADYTAGSEAELLSALTTAGGNPDLQSTITLTGNIALTAPLALPNKSIQIDPGGFILTGLTVNGASPLALLGPGIAPLQGASTVSDFRVSAGEARLLGGASAAVSNLTNITSTGKLVVNGVGSVLTTGSLAVSNPGSTTAVHVQNGGRIHATSTAVGGLGQSGAMDLQVTDDGSRLDIDTGTTTFGGGTNTSSWVISDGGAGTIGGPLIMGSQTSSGSVPSLKVTGEDSSLTLASLTLWRGTFGVLDGAEVSIGGGFGSGPRIGAGSAITLVSGAGSRLIVNGQTSLGANAPGSNGASYLTLADGGVLEARGNFTLGANFAATTGVLNIGGSEGGAAEAAGFLQTVMLTVGPGTGRLNFNHTETDYEFAPRITGSGAIRQVAGVTHLTGDSSGFSGMATISGGKLHVNGDFGGSVAVESGGTLAGVGAIGGNVSVADGVIAPGNSPGTLTIAGNLALDPASVLDMEFGLSNVVGGPMNDLIKVGGDVRLDGTVNASLTAGGSFEAGLYRIISYGGTLDDQGLTVGATPPGSTVLLQTALDGQVNLINTGGMTVNFWDGASVVGPGDGLIGGGNGDWTTTNGNWTTETGAFNTVYTPGDLLIFSGAPGAVTVDMVSIGTGGLQFAADGYRLTGGSISMDAGARTFRVGDGSEDGRNYVTIIDSPITGPGAGLTKTDLGTLILNGANTYSFATSVNAGTLIVNGSIAGGASGTVVNVNGTIGGTGQIRGGVVYGTLAPGGLTTPGTLTLNGQLSLSAAAELRYRLGQADTAGSPLNDLTVVNGPLTLDGTLNVTQSAGGSFTQGVYRLIDYTGALFDNTLDVGTLPTGFTGVIQTSIANQVNLIATGAVTPPPAGGGETEPPPPPPPPPVFNFWDGDNGVGGDGTITGGDGIWRASSNNWTSADGLANAGYEKGLFAIFAGAGGVVAVDGSEGEISVGGLQFAADGYRLAGDVVALEAGEALVRVGDGTSAGAQFTATIASELTGAGQLVKADGGTLVLTGASTYSGGTVVSGGVLQLGAGGTSGSITGDVAVDGTLAFNRSDAATFAGALSGGGTLLQVGSGTTTLSGDSPAFTGRTEVRNGALSVTGVLGGHLEILANGRLSGTGQLGALTNRGIIAPGLSVGTLTVAGDYAGAGGTLEMEAELGDDTSRADRLVVRGATSGPSLVDVKRVGGAGAVTQDGILLVQVDGASNGTFALAKGDYRLGGEEALIAGAYTYVLRKDEGGDWRLRSRVDEVAGPPGQPVGSSGQLVTLYQPGVPIYEAYPQALQLLNGVGTMRERTGAREWAGETGRGVWGRMEGGRTRLQPAVTTTGAALKADRWKLQFGAEPITAEDGAGGTITAGLTAYLGGAKTKVDSAYGGGTIDTEGYGVGANLTWLAAGGTYVDAQVQASWFDSDVTSSLLGRRADGAEGDGYALSLEAGHGFDAGGLRLTPQAQLSYSKVDFDSFTDSFGALVANDKSDSLIGRVGLGVDYSLSPAGSLYAVADLSHEFLDGTAIDVSGAPVVSRTERTWGGLAVGGTYAWDDGRYTLFGQASADTSLSDFGDSYDVGGTMGFRVRF